jgi:hypothetical protein
MLKLSSPLQRAHWNNQNGHIICLIWSPYEKPPSSIETGQFTDSVENRPTQPNFTLAWIVCEANRSAIVSHSIFYLSVLITLVGLFLLSVFSHSFFSCLKNCQSNTTAGHESERAPPPKPNHYLLNLPIDIQNWQRLWLTGLACVIRVDLDL